MQTGVLDAANTILQLTRRDGNTNPTDSTPANLYSHPRRLQLGNDGLTFEEQKSHFTLWSFLNSPLLLGSDIANMGADLQALLLNSEITGLNQDRLGYPGRIAGNTDNGQAEVWAKKLAANGAVAAILFNKWNVTTNITVDFKLHLNLTTGAAVDVRDLWLQKNVGEKVTSGSWTTSVPSHGVVALKVSPSTTPT
jgi:alpha-galactosidase